MTDNTPENLETTKKLMNAMASALDDTLNKDRKKRTTGFVLLVFPFDGPPGSRTNYVSNAADRKEVTAVLKEVAERFEKQSNTPSQSKPPPPE